MTRSMAEFTALAQGIYCIDALYIAPRVASIYLLRERDEVAIIETGSFHSVPNVLATLAELGIDRAQVKYVIPTHVHLDHAGGAGEMMRQFERATLIIHPRGAAHMIDPSRLVAGTIAVYGEKRFRELYGKIEPIAEERIVVAEDLASFHLGERELIFIDTPGHARHHFCIHDASSGGIFTGDTFGISYAPMKSLARGLVPTTPPSQFDPEALHRSVARLMSFAPRRLYLTHFGEFEDPGAQLGSFERWIDQYVELAREFDPDAGDAEAQLEQALTQAIIGTLGDNESLRQVLRGDIRLNAQGLAHWRRRETRG